MTARDPDILMPHEIARLFRVDPKTVSRWIGAGKFEGAFRTPGGHWRVPRETVEAMLRVDRPAGATP